MARATIDDFEKVEQYFDLMRKNDVTHIALLWMIDGDNYYGALYPIDTVLDKLLLFTTDKLLQVHLGVRLKPLQTRTDGRARNAAMLALWKAAEYVYRVPTKRGEEIFEQATAAAINGEWVGGQKNHPYDVKTATMHIECKGQSGLMQPDEVHIKRR